MVCVLDHSPPTAPVKLPTPALNQAGMEPPVLQTSLVTYYLPCKYYLISQQLRWDSGLRSQLGDLATSELNWNTEPVLDRVFTLQWHEPNPRPNWKELTHPNLNTTLTQNKEFDWPKD